MEDKNMENKPTPDAASGNRQGHGRKRHNRHRSGRGQGQNQNSTREERVENTNQPTSPAQPAPAGQSRQAHTVWSSSKKRPGQPTAPASPAPDAATAPDAQAKAPKSNDTRDRGEAKKGNGSNAAGNTAMGNAAAAPQRLPGQRPPRMPHKAARPAELPQMDNLLIEDTPAEETSADNGGYRPDAEELERILQAELYTPQSLRIPDVIPEGKVVIVGVRFRTGGKTYFFAPGDLKCTPGQHAIVETARGVEFGEICLGNRMVDEALVIPPLRPILRLATPEDLAHNKENHEKEADAYRIGVEKILAHKLDMKLVTVQYTFDNSKLLFYFTAAGRVDFRDLVKDLASVFHIRIELRQIGIRDEARMIGGLGACGRPLCCNTFLTDFGQVSMKMAKEQNLSLNSSKISGCCGRLMCCLRYEYDTYVEEIRRTPSVGTFVNTPDGPGVVTEMLPLLGEVKVSLRNQPDSAPKKYKREDVTPQAGRPQDTRPGDKEPSGRPAPAERAVAPADAEETDTEPEGDL